MLEEGFEVGSSYSREKKSINPEVQEEMNKFVQRQIEMRERENAIFSVGIDKGYLDKQIEHTHHEDERNLLELFRRFPEKLELKPGKTLIIGDNAAGKSTLAKALFLVCKKEITANNSRDVSVLLKDGDGFMAADESAEEIVFNPNGYWREWNLSSGAAPIIAKAMRIEDFSSAFPTVEYADFQEIIGSIKKGYDGSEIGAEVSNGMIGISTGEYMTSYGHEYSGAVERHLERVAQKSREMGSARQTVEKMASRLIHGESDESGSGIFFLDEPETGISPMRHGKIEENIDGMIDMDLHNGSITVIPTNSTKLFESDLPRIDLRYPERGIFRPSEFTDYFNGNE